MDTEKLTTALLVARRYIRTVEAWREGDVAKDNLDGIIRDFTSGNEIATIEAALLELGVIP